MKCEYLIDLKMNIKLNVLEENLSKKEMTSIVGGSGRCGCGCKYESQGGFSTDDNYMANNIADIPYSPDVPIEDQLYSGGILDGAIIVVDKDGGKN